MATFYWVGGLSGNAGVGNWNSSDATGWATTPTGPGGAGIPTLNDDVIIGQRSTTSTDYVSIGAGASCRTLRATDVEGGASSLYFSGSSTLNVAGSVYFSANGISWQSTGSINFSGSTADNVIDTKGVSVASITFQGTGAWYLASPILSRGSVQVYNGYLDTNGHSITATEFGSTGTNQRTLQLKSSVITLSSGINFSGSNLTISPGTSHITINNGSPTFLIVDQPLYDLTFATGLVPTTLAVLSKLTCHNLTIAGRATGVTKLSFSVGAVITGTLTISVGSTLGVSRYLIGSSTVGETKELQIGAASLTDVDFQDIAVLGNTITGTRLGDLGGNSNITFPSPKTVYWNISGTWSWNSTAWSSVAQGLPSNANFPLAQDTAVFTDNIADILLTLVNNYAYPSLDFSQRTRPITIEASPTLAIYGSLILSSAVTLQGTGTYILSGRNKVSRLSAPSGAIVPRGILIDCYTGTVELASWFQTTTTFTVNSGTFDTKNFPLGCVSFSSNSLKTRALKLGSSTITATGTGTPWYVTNLGTITVDGGTSDILLNSSTGPCTFSGGGFKYYNLHLQGAYVATITGSNTFNVIETAGNLVSLKFEANTHQILRQFWVFGSTTHKILLRSTVDGTRFFLKSLQAVSCSDIDVKDSEVSGAPWSPGSGSIDSGNNKGWRFPGWKPDATGNFFLSFGA